MIKISIEALRDHQACTLFYKYKHIDGLKKNETNLRKTQVNFKETLISIVNYFFFKKMAHQEPSYKALENRWEKRWLKDVDPDDIVYYQQSRNNNYPTDTYYTVKAAAALLEFHRYFANKPHLEVVMYGEDFTVPLNKEVAMEGVFDLVMRSKKPEGGYRYYIYTWSVNQGNKSSDYWSTHFTSLDYALRFRNKFKVGMDITHYLWDFTDPKPGIREFVIEIKDHTLLKIWADNFVKNQEFYPIRTLSSYCKTCIYDKPCLNWQPEQVEMPKLKKEGSSGIVSIAGEFLSTDLRPNWADDERLAALQDCIDMIHDVHIKALVSYMLSKSQAFWEAPVFNVRDGSYPPDEYEPGGMVRNTRRAIRAFWYLHHCMNFTLDEYYCAIAALLLRNVTKAVYIGEGSEKIVYDPFCLYTVDGFLQSISEDTRENHEDNGRVIGIEDNHLMLIMRLIRTSDGTMSIIPETLPITPLEQTVHMATLMGRACHEILLAVDEATYDPE